MFQTKLALYTSYVVSGRVAKGRVPDALFWDTADPYHYLRLQTHRDHDLVIFGGEDHKTGQASDTSACFDRLERTLQSMVGGVDVTHRWSGQVVETPDGLPYIGETAARQFAGTGYSGNGMTFGTLTAMMAADRVAGRRNPWTDLFDPGRKKIKGGLWDYIKENKDYPYYLIRDRGARRIAARRGGKISIYQRVEAAGFRYPAGRFPDLGNCAGVLTAHFQNTPQNAGTWLAVLPCRGRWLIWRRRDVRDSAVVAPCGSGGDDRRCTFRGLIERARHGTSLRARVPALPGAAAHLHQHTDGRHLCRALVHQVTA